MRTNKMSKVLMLAAGSVALLAAQEASATITLYSNMVAYSPSAGDRSIYGPHTGPGLGGAILDDCLIPNVINPGLDPIQVTNVTFGILRDPGAPGVTIEGVYASTTTPANPNDFPIMNNPVTAFGSATLLPYTGATTSMVFVNIPCNFTITPNFTDQPGYGELAIGLNLSNSGLGNNWQVALPGQGDANVDGAWDYSYALNANSAYALNDPNPPFNPIYTTFAMSVVGNVVPEPGAIGMLAGGAMMLLGRRPRRK